MHKENHYTFIKTGFLMSLMAVQEGAFKKMGQKHFEENFSWLMHSECALTLISVC